MDDRQIREKLGALLKAERERQEIALADLGEQLKISEAHLECIEQGNVTGLPSELYFSLFAKSYAQSIGIDYTRTLEAIKAELLEQASPVKKQSKTARNADGEEAVSEESSGFKTIAWVGGIIGGAFLIFIILNVFVFDSETTTSAEGGAVEPAGQVIDNAAYASYSWKAPKESVAPEPLKLTLLARDNVWTTVFSDGDTALRQTLTPGRTYSIEAEHRLQLWIAAPSRVSLTLNGESIDARDPQTNRVSGVEINQLNKDKFIAGEQVAASNERPTGANASSPAQSSPPPQTTTQTQDTTAVDRAGTDSEE